MESEVTYKPERLPNLRPPPDRFGAIDGLVLSGSIKDVSSRLAPVSGFYPEAGASLRRSLQCGLSARQIPRRQQGSTRNSISFRSFHECPDSVFGNGISMDQTYRILTDGSAIGNPGPDGGGVVVIQGKERWEMSSAHPWTTVSEMELVAADQALRSLRGRARIELHSDSEYLI